MSQPQLPNKKPRQHLYQKPSTKVALEMFVTYICIFAVSQFYFGLLLATTWEEHFCQHKPKEYPPSPRSTREKASIALSILTIPLFAFLFFRLMYDALGSIAHYNMRCMLKKLLDASPEGREELLLNYAKATFRDYEKKSKIEGDGEPGEAC